MTNQVENRKAEKQWLLSLMKKVQEIHAKGRNWNADDISSFLWSEPSPEFLELIFSKLDDHPTILQCRLINSHWKLGANLHLEKLQLAKWTHWNPQPSQLASAPVVRTFDKHLKARRSYYVASPKVMERCAGNPLPSNSLTIAGFKPYWARNDEVESKCLLREPKCAVGRIDKFMLRFGHFITSFTLHDLEVSVLDLEATFRHMQNLKALTFSSLHFRPRQMSLVTTDVVQSKEIITISPHLSHVQLKHSTRESVTWLLELCGSQLISLDMEGCVPIGSPLRLTQLHQLKVCRFEAENFNELVREMGECPCLEYLSLLLPIGNEVMLEWVMKFVNGFSTTLSSLYLDIEMGEGKKNQREKLVELLKNGKIFPVLKQLAITNVRGEWNVAKLKEVIKPKFPMLETLWFHGHSDWKEAIKVERMCICVGSSEVRIGVR